MKRAMGVIFMLGVLAGCKTTDEPKPVSWERQQLYLNRVMDPRVYGLDLVETSAGVRIRGGGRMHYSQSDALDLLVSEPMRPVVSLKGRVQQEWVVLFDLTAAHTLFEFDTAREMDARPIAEGSAKLIDLPADDAPGCVSLIPTLRLGQVFVENPLVLVRMKNGLPASADRGISEPRPKGVIGWDVLRKMEQVQFLYSLGKVVLKSSESYEPNPYELLATIPLAAAVRGCAVNGSVDGVPVPVLIDPLGDFEVATPQGTPVSTLLLAEGIACSNPTVAVSPGGVRVGARLLERYRVTVCPKQKVLHFEARSSGEE